MMFGKPVVSVLFLLAVWTVSGGEEKSGRSGVKAALTSADLDRLKGVLAKTWDLKDPLVTSYAVLSYSVLNLQLQKPAEVCKFLQSSLDGLDGTKLEPVFALSTAITKVPSCKAAFKPALKTALEQVVKQGGSSQDIFYATEALKSSGAAVDGGKIAEVLKASTKADDSAQSLGYGLWVSASVAKSGQKLDIWERIEDVVAQADEVDSQYLQFEGGLSVTAAVINGIVRLAETVNKPLPLTADQLIKFGNYLVSRKTVTTPRGVFLLTSALDALSKNKFMKPVFVGLNGVTVLNEGNRIISIRASDLLGRPLDISLQLESVSGSSDGKKVAGIELIQAVPSPTDKTLYTVDLKGKTLPKGFYNIVLNSKSTKNDKTLILQPTTAQIKVVGKLGTVTARVGVSNVDQRASIKWSDLNKGQKLSTPLETLDSNNKLTIKVTTPESLHQVFLVLRNKETKSEVAFIAQPETEGQTDYKVELDLSVNSKDLGYKSGAYELVLYLGDFLLEDSVEWNVGDVNLKLGGGKPKAVNPLYAVSYGPKPEIKHMFRQPEPRPARFLSDAFTLLVLSPMVILLALWVKIGVNIKNFPLSLSALGFHLGLVAMFGVYGLFWLKLSMFEALKWMTVPSLVTFVAGNRLLKHIAERRASSTNK